MENIPEPETIYDSITKHESAFQTLFPSLRFDEPIYLPKLDDYYSIKIPCYWSQHGIPRFILLHFKVKRTRNKDWIAEFIPFNSEPHTTNWGQLYYIDSPAMFYKLEKELVEVFSKKALSSRK